MSANQLRSPLILGFLPRSPSSATGTLALSTAASGGFSATWLALGFTPSDTKTVNELSLPVSAVGGTLGASDLVGDVWSDNSGVPNTGSASISGTTTVNATPTGAAWVRFTGLSAAVTAGTQYWAVFRNANASPATNFPTYRFGAADTQHAFFSQQLKWGWGKVHTTNSGAAWATSPAASVVGLRVGYSDSTYDGFPASNIATAADRAYSAREPGVRFVSPDGVTLNVRGLAFSIRSQNPSGNLRFRLYTGSSSTPTLQATTAAIANALVTAGNWYAAYFSSAVAVAPGTVVRITIGNTAADDSTHWFALDDYTVDTDSNSLLLLPWYTGVSGSQCQHTYTTDGTNFTDTNSLISAHALLLDSIAPFTASGSGGSFWMEG